MGSVAPVGLEIREEPITALEEYARVPIAFEVDRVAVVMRRAGGGFELRDRATPNPWLKDYDATPGQDPTTWPARFDLSHWVLFAARLSGNRVGGAAVAFLTPGLDMLEERRDLAVIWDLRVAPSHRRRGVGSGLLEAAQAWARARGCHEVKVETQDVNLPACRFYGKHGFVLRTVTPSAYPEFPGEAQLLWYKELLPER